MTFEESVSDDKVCVIKKTYSDSELLLVYNLAPESVEVDLSGVTAGEKSGSDLEVGGVLLTGTEDNSGIFGGDSEIICQAVPGRFKRLRTEQAVMCLPIQLVVQQEIRKFRIVIFLLGAAENTKVAAVINAIFLDPLIIGQFDRTWIGL